MVLNGNLVKLRSHWGEIIGDVFLDLLRLSPKNLPETWRLLAVHEGRDLSFALPLVLVYLFCKQP